MEGRTYSVAIVEDNAAESDLLKQCLLKYSAEEFGKNVFEIVCYPNALQFTGVRRAFDIVFMDIDMPDMTGMEAARALRDAGGSSVLVFVTNLARFAVEGYSVDALDFIVKPVNYNLLKTKMKKILHAADMLKSDSITVSSAGALVQVPVKQLLYVEVSSHNLIYHCVDKTLNSWGTLSEEQKCLAPYGFLRCNSCFLVNPAHISSIEGYDVTLTGGGTISISHPKKKAFMQEYLKWAGDNL